MRWPTSPLHLCMHHLSVCVLECKPGCACPCHVPKIITETEKEFLQQSNEIEGVYDINSLSQAMEAWKYLREKTEIHVGVVLKVHKILMLHQALAPNEKGYFRLIPVYIAGRKCETMENGKSLTQQITDWCKLVNIAAIDPHHLHVMFEKIHPFVDGNGRVGRMFLNWQRLKMGKDILIIKANERQQYYKWFAD